MPHFCRCFLQVTTLPIDTAKVRLQLTRKAREAGAGAAASAPTKSAGMVGIMVNVAKEEGFFALYKGFWPAIHRQLVFATLRVGLYGQVRLGNVVPLDCLCYRASASTLPTCCFLVRRFSADHILVQEAW